MRTTFPGRHNSAMITDLRKFTTKLTIYGIPVTIFTVSINSVFPLGCMLRTGNLPTQIFGSVGSEVAH